MTDRRRRKVRFMGCDFVRDEEALGEWYRCDCYELTTDYGECGDGKFRWSWSLCFGVQGRIDGPSRTTPSAAREALENEVSKLQLLFYRQLDDWGLIKHPEEDDV